jgi:general secretion pathway protein J
VTVSRDPAAGFSLVEVLVALAVFALIGSAGFVLLDQVIRTQNQTEGRLERMAELQRAAHLIRIDFGQASGTSLDFDTDTTPVSLSFRRSGATIGAAPVTIVYSQEYDVLQRVIQNGDATNTVQPLLRDVTDAQWRFFDAASGWTDQWPPADRQIVPGQPVANPQAVELTVTLAPRNEILRRIVLLPAEVQ